MNAISRRSALVAAALLVSVASASATAQRVLADLTGKWAISVMLPDRTSESLIDWKQTGDSLSGTVEVESMGTRDIVGTVKGDTVRFEFSIDMQGQVIGIRGVGVVRDANTLEGRLDLPNDMGSLPYSAKRRP